MALNWTENQEIRIQRASSLWAHGGSDMYAKRDNREYSIAKDEEDDQKWHFAMRAAGQLADVGLFSSLDAAKQRAEEHERIERNGRYEEAYNGAKLEKPDVTVDVQKEFGDLWADKYYAEGLTLDEAWK